MAGVITAAAGASAAGAPGAGRYAIGLLALAGLAGSLGLAALRLRRRFAPGLSGAFARLTEVVIGLTLLTFLMELLGLLGLFSLGPIVIATAGVGLGALRVHPGHVGPSRQVSVAGRGVSWVLLGVLGLTTAAVVAEWAGPTLLAYRHGIRSFDSLWYHLPWAASFAQSGAITPLHFTDVEYMTAFYPAGAELIHGLGIVLGGGDALSPGLNLVWLGLVLLGAFCVGQPLRAGLGTLLGGALAMALPMVLGSQAGSAANDVVAIFFVVAAAALVIRSDGRDALLGLAGAAAGLAISVKLSVLAPVGALTVGVLIIHRGWRPALLWLAPLVSAGGFWYLRNLIAVGNPLPWLKLPGLATPAPALQEHTGYSVAHYLGTGGIWQHVLGPGLAAGLGSWWWAVLALAIVGPLLCLLPGAEQRVRLLAGVALVSLFAYLVTPETAAGPAGQPLGFAFNLRYAAPALTLSLIVLPLAPPLRTHRGRIVTAGVLATVLGVTLSRSRDWPGSEVAGQLIAGTCVLAAVALAITGPALPRRARAAGAVALLVIATALGFVGQRSYFTHRYVFAPGVSQLSLVWASFRGVHNARVGIVGTYGGFFAYPLFGLRSSNAVGYIAHRGSHGSFSPIASCPGWRRAVNAAHVNLLVTTPARDPWRPRLLGPSPEGGWTSGDPHASVAYHSRAAGQAITVFDIHGRLDPRGCG